MQKQPQVHANQAQIVESEMVKKRIESIQNARTQEMDQQRLQGLMTLKCIFTEEIKVGAIDHTKFYSVAELFNLFFNGKEASEQNLIKLEFLCLNIPNTVYGKAIDGKDSRWYLGMHLEGFVKAYPEVFARV